MKIKNKEMLLYSMNKAYEELSNAMDNADTSEQEVYFRLGSCLHWLIDCYDRLPHEKHAQETMEFFEGLRGANNCLKHNRMLHKFEEAAGGNRYPRKYPYSYTAYYVWGSIEEIKV